MSLAYLKNPDSPLIRDLIIEGLSLARTQKEEFASVLNSNDDDIKALNEIYRVLKSGGVAILQVPINFKKDKTFEDQSITSKKDREKYFGQYDHLREYGLDFKDRVEKAGFDVEMVYYAENFSEEMKFKYGLQINDVIPVARKSSSN